MTAPSFLDQVVQHIRQRFGQQLDGLCLVLPTRRAVVFMRDALVRRYGQTLWAPRIVSIQDFIREHAGRQFPETVALVFSLYQVYQRHIRPEGAAAPEPFDRFYSWGEMLLKDFDEIDKYCVDAAQLFSNIRDLREIEVKFSLPAEKQAEILSFWQSVIPREGQSPTELQDRFLRIWEKLHPVYEDFRKQLAAQGQAYEGMAYRELADRATRGTHSFPYEKTLFIGFYALSIAEMRLIEALLLKQEAMIFWDADKAYFSEQGQEQAFISEIPGKFIHLFHDRWNQLESHLILNDMGAKEKNIYITQVAQPVGQAHYLGNLLAALPESAQNIKHTAIVLADEHMLFPVLYALPSAVKNLNITMGFPLRQTHIYYLLMTLLRLIRQVKDHDGKLAFPYQEVFEILDNPYIRRVAPAFSQQLQEEAKKRNWVYIPEEALLRDSSAPLLQHMFRMPQNLAACIAYFAQLFDHLLKDAHQREAHVEAEFIYQFYLQFNLFRDILQQYEIPLNIHTFTRIFQELIRKVRIPFEGEPLIGIQIMGFLETRVLDFSRIYLLGANEGQLPDTQTGNSFIPFNLRKGFGLPTFEEKDTIYAYHFYRLIQRAEEVHLVYDASEQGDGKFGEVSRFIRQMRYFLAGHPAIHLHEQHIETPAPYISASPIRVPHDAETASILLDKFALPPHGQGRQYFSATALTTYLACPLRFYYRYLLELEEPETLEETMEAGTFGNILHKTLETLYRDHTGQVLGKEQLPKLKDSLPEALAGAFESEKIAWDALRGTNLLWRDVIRKLCLQIIRHDLQGPPFVVRHLEEKRQFTQTMTVEGKSFRLNGTLDRVDFLPESSLTRIVDYKTGRVKDFNLKTKGWEGLFEDDAYKVHFQGFLYAWLFLRQFPDQAVSVGIYHARELADGLKSICGEERITSDFLLPFEAQLIALIEKILQADFVQTEDEKQCQICPYQAICNRGIQPR